MNEFLEEFFTTNYFLSSNENTVTTTNKTFQEYCAVFYNIHPDINFFFFLEPLWDSFTNYIWKEYSK